jgi:hypothetical protein
MMVLTRLDAHRRADQVLFRVIYGATLPAFLLAATLARLAPGRRRAVRPSPLREAQAAARTCGSFALMG